MNKHIAKYSGLLTAGMLMMTLSGCGDEGTPGKPGEPGGPAADSAQQLHFTFNQSQINQGKAQVKFLVTNEEDLPVVGLQQFRFAIAQLMPEGVKGPGETSQWQYYGDETCNVADKCPGEFIDHKNGHYSYQFAMNLTDNAKVDFNSQLPQRILIRSYPTPLPSGAPMPNTNAYIDFSADGDLAHSTRIIVTNESCNACHQDISATKHGGAYNEVQYCATCHTDDKVRDGNQFSQMIHRKHVWLNDSNAFEFAVDGVNTCSSCHLEDLGTPNFANWSRMPTAESCGSCHTNVDFKTGQGHPVQPDNGNCIACHNKNWTENIHTGKNTAQRKLIDSYGLITDLSTNDDNSVTMQIGITDKNGQLIDPQTMLGQIKQLETITNLGPNNAVMGYNPAPETEYKKEAYNLVKDGQLQTGASIVDNKLQLTTKPLPFAGGDSNTAFTFVGLGMCHDAEMKFIDCASSTDFTGMKASIAFTTKTADEATPRHIDSVDANSCINCHGDTFDIHKGYHAGFVISDQLAREVNGEQVIGLDGCVSCHNPHGTYASGANKGAFELKLHKTHNEKAAGLIADNCSQCHINFNLDAFNNKGALATSFDDETNKGLYTTPITATCTSCHVVGTDAMQKHTVDQLEQFGAIIDGDFRQAEDAAQSETCLFCHKPSLFNHGAVQM